MPNMRRGLQNFPGNVRRLRAGLRGGGDGGGAWFPQLTEGIGRRSPRGEQRGHGGGAVSLWHSMPAPDCGRLGLRKGFCDALWKGVDAGGGAFSSVYSPTAACAGRWSVVGLGASVDGTGEIAEKRFPARTAAVALPWTSHALPLLRRKGILSCISGSPPSQVDGKDPLAPVLTQRESVWSSVAAKESRLPAHMIVGVVSLARESIMSVCDATESLSVMSSSVRAIVSSDLAHGAQRDLPFSVPALSTHPRRRSRSHHITMMKSSKATTTVSTAAAMIHFLSTTWDALLPGTTVGESEGEGEI